MFQVNGLGENLRDQICDPASSFVRLLLRLLLLLKLVINKGRASYTQNVTCINVGGAGDLSGAVSFSALLCMSQGPKMLGTHGHQRLALDSDSKLVAKED